MSSSRQGPRRVICRSLINVALSFIPYNLFIHVNSVFLLQVIGGRGNNLHEVEASDKSQFLVSMPPKFRKNVWIKRGISILTFLQVMPRKHLIDLSYVKLDYHDN